MNCYGQLDVTQQLFVMCVLLPSMFFLTRTDFMVLQLASFLIHFAKNSTEANDRDCLQLQWVESFFLLRFESLTVTLNWRTAIQSLFISCLYVVFDVVHVLILCLWWILVLFYVGLVRLPKVFHCSFADVKEIAFSTFWINIKHKILVKPLQNEDIDS